MTYRRDNPYPVHEGNRIGPRPEDHAPLPAVGIAGAWYYVDPSSPEVRYGKAVTLAQTGYRSITLANTLAVGAMPAIAGVALMTGRGGETISVAWAGTVPRELTGLPAQPGLVTVRGDGALEIDGSGIAIGRTNGDGTLLLQLNAAVSPSGDTVLPYDELPEPVGAVGATGSSSRFLPGDHAHAHGTHSDGSNHAEASGDGAGFAPGTSLANDGDVLTVAADGSVGYEPVEGALPYTSVPEDVAATGATGASPLHSPGDHAHAHGSHTDPTNHALAGAAGAGFLLGTSGASDGHVPTVQADGSIAYEAPAAGGVTDHGSLTGLGDDDHALYLLVSGARALGGTWSLAGFALTNVGNLTATGTPTWDLNGGDLTTVDDIILQGPASQITMSNGQIVNCDTMLFNGDLSVLSGLDQQTLHDSGSYIDGNDGELRDFSRLDRTTGTLAIEAEAGSLDLDASIDVFINAADDIVATAANDLVLEATNGTAILRSPGVGQQVTISAHTEVDITVPTVDINGSTIVDIDGAAVEVTATSTDLTLAATDDIIQNAGDVIVATAGNDFDVFAARLDMNSNPIEQVSSIQMTDGDSLSGSPTAGFARIGTYSGPDSSNPGGMLSVFSRLFLWQFPIACEINNAASGADTVVANINFASVRGYDFSDSTLIVRISIMSTRTDSSEAAYDGHAETGLYYVSTNQSGNMHMSPMEQGMPAYGALGSSAINVWQEDNGSNDAISWSETGASTVAITGTLKSNPGTRRLMLLVSIEWAQVPP